MQPRLDLLWPRPQSIEPTGERLALPPSPTLWTAPFPSARHRLDADLARLGLAPRPAASAADATVRCCRDASLEARLGREGYRLSVDATGAEIRAAHDAGIFYGAVTLGQWLALHRAPGEERPADVEGVRVVDRPDFPARGVLLDVSRDKVPRLDTLFELVDRLAGLKYNQLQLYTEHAFAYRGHEAVWRDASPLCGEEIRQLDAHAKGRHVELVPNQQSFGHFHRWLVHPEYRPLAECPEGFSHPFSLAPEPFSLCPTDPRSLELLADLYAQLLPHFTSRSFNVGLDETLDLGHGRSREACEKDGRERVYLDFLRRVRDLAAEHGRRIQFWGDIILKRPELLEQVPEDAVALEWGYEADHPFAEEAGRFAAAGRELYVCPGTSSWNSFAGRVPNAVANLASAAAHGHAHGAGGYLVTDWGDFGHLQPLPVSYPGYVAGAGFAWNVASAPNAASASSDASVSSDGSGAGLPLAELVDLWAVDDRAGVLGGVLCDLGAAGPAVLNGTAPFFMTVWALLERERERIAGVSVEQLEASSARVAAALDRLRDARPANRELLESEIRWAGDLVRFGCRLGRERLASGDLGSFAGLERSRRQGLAKELRELLERHRAVVLGRHRPGGLAASRAWLERVARLLAEA